MVFQWFFFSSEPSLMMVFHISTIGINGFPMVFPLETMVFQWFFIIGLLALMVFLPLNHWYQWFLQWLLTVETLVSMVFQWFWESERWSYYHHTITIAIKLKMKHCFWDKTTLFGILTPHAHQIHRFLHFSLCFWQFILYIGWALDDW